MNEVKKINWAFFWTVVIYLIGANISGMLMTMGGNMFMVLLLSQLFIFIPTLVYLVKSRMNVVETIRFKKISFSNVILIILFAYLMMPLMGLINMISQLFAKNLIGDSINEIVTSNPLALSLFVVAFIPCVFEEVVYRGVFYNEYSKVSKIKGIFLSALLFGLLHMNFNQFSYAFTMGAIFALLIEATDSILSSMIAHFVINGTSVVLVYLLPVINKWTTSLLGEKASVVSDQIITRELLLTTIKSYSFLAIITTSLAFLVYRSIAKNSRRLELVSAIVENKGNLGREQKSKIISAPLIVGMLICTVIMIISEFN